MAGDLFPLDSIYIEPPKLRVKRLGIYPFTRRYLGLKWEMILHVIDKLTIDKYPLEHHTCGLGFTGVGSRVGARLNRSCSLLYYQ